MSFEFLEQTAKAIGQMGCSMEQATCVVGEMSEAMGKCSHAEGYGSLPKDLIGIGGFTKDGYEYLGADGEWKEVKLPKKENTIDNIVKMSVYRG